MFSSRSVPQQIRKASDSSQAAEPDYEQLIRFLFQPFLESSNSLSLDCEVFPSTARIWIRIAFEGEDKGRVFGRGGRNIQAIRTVVAAAAAAVGHSAYLDIYGSQAFNSTLDDMDAEQVERVKPKERRSTNPIKPIVKPRSASFE